MRISFLSKAKRGDIVEDLENYKHTLDSWDINKVGG